MSLVKLWDAATKQFDTKAKQNNASKKALDAAHSHAPFVKTLKDLDEGFDEQSKLKIDAALPSLDDDAKRLKKNILGAAFGEPDAVRKLLKDLEGDLAEIEKAAKARYNSFLKERGRLDTESSNIFEDLVDGVRKKYRTLDKIQIELLADEEKIGKLTPKLLTAAEAARDFVKTNHQGDWHAAAADPTYQNLAADFKTKKADLQKVVAERGQQLHDYETQVKDVLTWVNKLKHYMDDKENQKAHKGSQTWTYALDNIKMLDDALKALIAMKTVEPKLRTELSSHKIDL